MTQLVSRPQQNRYQLQQRIVIRATCNTAYVPPDTSGSTEASILLRIKPLKTSQGPPLPPFERPHVNPHRSLLLSTMTDSTIGSCPDLVQSAQSSIRIQLLMASLSSHIDFASLRGGLCWEQLEHGPDEGRLLSRVKQEFIYELAGARTVVTTSPSREKLPLTLMVHCRSRLFRRSPVGPRTLFSFEA